MASAVTIAVEKQFGGGRDSMGDATQLHLSIVMLLTISNSTPRTKHFPTIGAPGHALTSIPLLKHSKDRGHGHEEHFGNRGAFIDELDRSWRSQHQKVLFPITGHAHGKFTPDGQRCPLETHCTAAHYPTESVIHTVQSGRQCGFSMLFALTRLSPKRHLRNDPGRLSLCTLRLTTSIETDPGHDMLRTVFFFTEDTLMLTSSCRRFDRSSGNSCSSHG